jgi:hypothetical protein
LSVNLDGALGDPARYERELERLHARLPARRLRAVSEDGVPLKVLVLERRQVARLLAAEVARGSWRPRPAALRRAWLDKERLLFVFGAVDLVVAGVVAGVLAEALEPALSPRVHSYRRGRSAHAAVRHFAREVRRHVAARPDPRTRGLHVLHCDVQSFGDSVPLGPGSPLWGDLRALATGSERAWDVVTRVVRPPVLGDGEAEALRGLPTGSPVVPPITNLYLSAVDRAVEALPGFYLRYGDDLLFAHPDADVAREAQGAIERALAARGLSLNPRKRQVVWLNGAGRAAPAWDEARGAPAIDLLGLRVDFHGTIGLPRRKVRELLADLRARVARARALAGLPELVAAVASALDPSSPFATRHAPLLRSLVTDRRQLAQIDRLIAEAVAAAASPRPGVRAFRDAPPRRLRALGLPSLLAARNRGGG